MKKVKQIDIDYLEKHQEQIPAINEIKDDISKINKYIDSNQDWRARVALMKLRRILKSWIPY